MDIIRRILGREDPPHPTLPADPTSTATALPEGMTVVPLTEGQRAAWQDQQDEQHRITISPPGPDGTRTISLDPHKEFPMSEPTRRPETLADVADTWSREEPPTEPRLNQGTPWNSPLPPADRNEQATAEPDPTPQPVDPPAEPDLEINSEDLCGYCGQRIPGDAEFLRITLDLVTSTGVADQLPPYFYSRLFARHPELQALFEHTDMNAQNDRILNSIVLLCQHYGDDETNSPDPEMLERSLIAMGRAHVRFNLDVHHYAWVGTALLETVHHFAGPHWTPALGAAWRRAYKYMAGVMLEGESRPNRGGTGRRRATR